MTECGARQRWIESQQALLEGDVAVIDGSVATELQHRLGTSALDEKVWAARASVNHPDVIRSIHEEGLEHGANIVVANTYYTSLTTVGPAGHSISDSVAYTRAAVTLAIAARDAKNPDALVAGSLSCHPPLMPKGSEVSAGKWPQPDEELANATQHAMLLQECGCDLIVVEMLCDLTHGMRAVEAACSVGLPVFLSFAFPYSSASKHGVRLTEAIHSGEPIRLGGAGDTLLSEAVVAYTARFAISAILVHQTPLPLVIPALRGIRDGGWTGPLGAYPMHGSFASPEWHFDSLANSVLRSAAKAWVTECAVQIVGVGSGLTRRHLSRLAGDAPSLSEEGGFALKERLHRAIAAGRDVVRQGLLDVDLTTRQGQCPLHTAVLLGDAAVAKALLLEGADTTLKDDLGLTPADTACLVGHTDLRDYIRSHSQGPRKTFHLSLGHAAESLGLDLRQIEGQRCVRIMGIAPGSVGERHRVPTGIVLRLNQTQVRSLTDVRKAMEAVRSGDFCSFMLVVQCDPHYAEGAVVEVTKDLVVGGKTAVRKGTVATVKYEKKDDGGGRRVVLRGIERLDGRSGAVGAMPFEIAHYSAGHIKSEASVTPTGIFYDTKLADIVTVCKRGAGAYTATAPDAMWSPAVLSVKSTLVTFRGSRGVNMVGVWIGDAVVWSESHSWVLSPATGDTTPAAEGLAVSPDAERSSMMKMLQRQFSKSFGSMMPRGSEEDNSNGRIGGGSLRTERPAAAASFAAKPKLPPMAKPAPPALHAAVQQGDAELVSALLKQGHAVEATDPSGRTALHIAAHEGFAEIAEVLLQAGCDTTLCNGEGHTAADTAALRGKGGLRMRLREAAQGPRKVYTLKPKQGEALGLDLKEQKGHVQITGVKPGGAAERAGVHLGWVAALEGKRVRTLSDVLAAVSASKAAQRKALALVVQLRAPPRCPSGHAMVAAKGVPEDLRAYVPADGEDMEDDLFLACDICEAEDLQDHAKYYHCRECEHDVCDACGAVSEFGVGKTVDVITELMFNGKVAAHRDTKAVVAGAVAAQDGSRRVIVKADRCDGSSGLLGVLPQEIALSLEQINSPAHVVERFSLQADADVKASLSPGAPVVCRHPRGTLLTVLEKRQKDGAVWLLVTCGISEKDGWLPSQSCGLQAGLPSFPSMQMSECDEAFEAVGMSVSQISEPPACLNVSFGLSALWGGSPAQQPYRDRWMSHIMNHSASSSRFVPPTLEATQFVWATSDIHVDHSANLVWLKTLPPADPQGNEFRKGTLIVAGDVCTKLSLMQEAFKLLKAAFQHVFYCVGNHELWQWGKGTPDSLEKFFDILRVCDEEGVQTVPCVVGGALICPLQSWYQSNFVDGSGNVDQTTAFFDAGCMWPPCIGDPGNERNSLVDSIGDFFLSLNQPTLQGLPYLKARPDMCITFSHFIPRTELFPSRHRLCRVMGTRTLDSIIRDVNAQVHVFGHSHIDYDLLIDGCRYLQSNLGYPRDRVGTRLPSIIWSAS